ncbi:MAG: alpha-D-ribose 1-methylphosphonate 5-triphosphate diphosphatase [Opitutales bacterium]
MSNATIISNARVVTRTENFEGSVVIEDGIIAEIIKERTYAEGIDARGRWLTPGVIDTHTDYIEKEIAPRPSAEIPLELAFHMMDQRAIATGLTTVLGAVRVSADKEKKGSMWRRDGLELGRRYEELSKTAKARHLMHVRWDTNFQPADPKIDVLKTFTTLGNIVYNENIPGERQFRDLKELAKKFADRQGITPEEALKNLQEKIETNRGINNRPQVRDTFSGNVPLGSHDDTTIEHVIEAHAMGCSIAEMPTTSEAAQKAKDLGLIVIMGAPNYYRGGSHCGNVGAPEAFQKGLMDVLCSDYHFPSLLGSVCKMFAEGIDPSKAVNLVTYNAAKALNRDEKIGSIEVGKLADLTLFASHPNYAEVTHTWIGGELVYQSTHAVGVERHQDARQLLNQL